MKLFLSCCLALVFVQHEAMAGRMSHGGDPVGLEFTQNAHSAIDTVLADASAYPQLKNVDLNSILDHAEVLVTDGPLVVEENGVTQESAAINTPSTNTIMINRSRWEAIATAQIKSAVALHEVLGLAGIEGTGVYTISQRYLNSTGNPCKNSVCADEVAESAFNVLSPDTGIVVFGTIQVRGQAGSQWVNVAVYDVFDNYRKIGLDFSPSNDSYSIPVDTTQLTDGPHRVAVIAFSVAAGLPWGNSTQVYFDLYVQNHH